MDGNPPTSCCVFGDFLAAITRLGQAKVEESMVMGAQISELDQRRQKENMVIWMAGWIPTLCVNEMYHEDASIFFFEIQYVYHFLVVWEVFDFRHSF